MDESQDFSHRVIELTTAAAYDLASIDSATAVTWGEAQANRYVGFLRELFSNLAMEPTLGTSLEDFPGVLMHVAKFNRRRSSHGHRIFYREIDGGIRIIRILHTAMQWPDHLTIEP